MKRESKQFFVLKKDKNKTVASFSYTDRLTVLNSEAMRLRLLDIVTNRNSELEINLDGIRFIDNSVIDVFNILSRMAKRFDSVVRLTNVGAKLMELIELVKIHSVFDIKRIEPKIQPEYVA